MGKVVHGKHTRNRIERTLERNGVTGQAIRLFERTRRRFGSNGIVSRPRFGDFVGTQIESMNVRDPRPIPFVNISTSSAR